MGGFVKGDIVIIPFPFSDLSGSKNARHLWRLNCILSVTGHLSENKIRDALNAIITIISF